MKIFKQTSDLYQKVEKLRAYADELGITLEVISNNIVVTSNVAGEPSGIIIDMECDDNVTCFPPLTEFRIKVLGE